MPPIQLTRSERASLKKLCKRARQPGEIPASHEEKFLNYALIRKQVLLLSITPLGQLELMRQRFQSKAPPAIRETRASRLLPPFRRVPLLTSDPASGV